MLYFSRIDSVYVEGIQHHRDLQERRRMVPSLLHPELTLELLGCIIVVC